MKTKQNPTNKGIGLALFLILAGVAAIVVAVVLTLVVYEIDKAVNPRPLPVEQGGHIPFQQNINTNTPVQNVVPAEQEEQEEYKSPMIYSRDS